MKLTEPVTLAGRRAPSRVLFGPHETNLARGRAISAAHVAYYERRAAGGAGLIVTETASVHDSDWPYERAPLAADCGEGWASVVQACRPHGTLVLAGLGHAGSQGSSAFSQQALWAPSRVPDVASREMPMEMEAAEIRAVVAGFTRAAELAVEADLDGVEVDAGQHALLRQFLSGLTNQRGDAYGTDKALLLREVLAAVRARIGDGRVLGLRLSCDELAPWAGITPEQAREVAKDLARGVDYLVVVRGSAMGTSATRPDSHTEPGFNTELCRGIREAVAGAAPVILQGSVVEPGQAEQALADGVADLVEMTRAQIADAELVRKLGTAEPVRPCTLTNQKCRVRDNRNPIVSCIGDPRSGHETGDAPVDGTAGTDPARSVLVVGGGPAGLEAARVLALRGHRVRLVEREAALGGMLTLAARVPGRDRLGNLARWLVAEVHRLGVEVAVNTEADLAELSGDVVVATGSVAGPRRYTVRDGGFVLDVVDLLTAPDRLPEGPVAVYDPVGDAVGVGIAELAAAAGRPTTIITQDQVVGTQLALTGDLADANARLQRAGVRLAKRSLLREVHAGHVVVTDAYTGTATELECATLIHCGHRLPDPTPVPAGMVEAGDRVAPRSVHEAVLEGRRAALAFAAKPLAVHR
ncbi:mycofactocin system FadH/OYE family oxidoreductase 1 [Prauserella flavalba]|uniref:2,4-dienoyl-CoA reductase n=1 Tax=Prauserella flavalba TaxID=1477506 RepID=A0A318LR58_9PSEU|nr:mycofactocin system FadH/OYE family oxidoreductase 1 [Prauserella flavalba]PXY24093.1 2,4-dienoyl-CoA reductase [Prauserella flavalba]